MEQFRKGAIVPHYGELCRVTGATVINNHLCYTVEDLQGNTVRGVHYLQHAQIVKELKEMATYAVGDQVRLRNVFGHLHVKARWWDSRKGLLMYRVTDYYEESRMPWIRSQAELDALVVERILPATLKTPTGAEAPADANK
ncbi:MAG: hypothetical protein IPJ76_07425 [Flavobacteriales bacterium]|nr:MAG: hypothetical protein IPJ76_07425 [Flavobacteriales bacterium]